MGIDLAQFHQIFVEEAKEQLLEIEQLLLGIEGGSASPEQINHLFRLFHSVKGGAATFGFDDLVAPAHDIETALDQVRQGQASWTPDLRDQLLSGRDVLWSRLFPEALHIESQDDDDSNEHKPNEQRPGEHRPGMALANSSGAGDAGSESGGTLRVSTERVDKLINLVGELVIVQEMLMVDAQNSDLNLLNKLSTLRRHTHALQDSVLSMRMVPVELVFQRFPRLVHDISGRLGKQAQLVMEGTGTELDKGMVEQLIDPLTHLVRNCLDHGIESPEERVAAGKSVQGKITLAARHEGGAVVITVSDDGNGLNRERLLAKAETLGIPMPSDASDEHVWSLIFMPGFSTASQVTDLSGRGVGMDVVRQNITSLGGNVRVQSQPKQGTEFSITLPLTLAILDAMRLRVGGHSYVMPVSHILETLVVQPGMVYQVGGVGQAIRLRDQVIPVVDLAARLGIGHCPDAVDLQPCEQGKGQSVMVIVQAEQRTAALWVDEVQSQQQVVIKSLAKNFRPVEGFSGATILGDGSVALILDIAAILNPGRGIRGALGAAESTHKAENNRLLETAETEAWGMF